jgi:hypothetical protein
VSTVVLYGAAVSVAPCFTPSTWNSTPVTPTSSVAVAVNASVPVSPAAKAAGAVSVATGA